MLGVIYSTSTQVVIIIIFTLMILNTLYCFVLHRKKEKYFNKAYSTCGYIVLVSFISGFIAGTSLIIIYALLNQVFDKFINKVNLLHLMYLIPLFVCNLYLLNKSWFFQMKLENGYLMIRNAFGIKTNYSIYKLKYKRKFGLFTILYFGNKRKILIQSDYLLYNLDYILDRIPIQ